LVGWFHICDWERQFSAKKYSADKNQPAWQVVLHPLERQTNKKNENENETNNPNSATATKPQPPFCMMK